jgi:hypothetical protein
MLRKYFNIIFPLVLIAIVLSGFAKYDFSYRGLLNNARISAKALMKKYTFYFNYYTGKEKHITYPFLWYEADYEKSGVTVYKEGDSFNGLTFFTNHTTKAFLIDMHGNIVHQWSKPFKDVWPEAKHLLDRGPETMVYWRKARLFPNGDIIAIYEGINQTPYGGGIIKLDKDSNLIWKVDINAHHDFDIDENGNVHTLMHEYLYDDNLEKPLIADGIAIISPEGHLLKKIPLLPKFYDTAYQIYINWKIVDPFHSNNLELLREDKAKYFPMFNTGDILISMCSPSIVFVLDAKSYAPKWGLYEITKHQHDPDFLDDGTILIFDNHGAVDFGGGRSQLVSIKPDDRSFKWHFTGTTDKTFQSENRGSQQKLPNGNVLITESTGGRIFEVSHYGKIVWEYISESLEPGNIGIICDAERYREEDLSFLREQNTDIPNL